MTRMRRALSGIAFAAMLSLSLTATAGTAAAASIAPDRGAAVEGRGQRAPQPPRITIGTSGGIRLQALGVTWED